MNKKLITLITGAAFAITCMFPASSFATVESVADYDEGYTWEQTKTIETGEKAARTSTKTENIEDEYSRYTQKLKEKKTKVNNVSYSFRISKVGEAFTMRQDTVTKRTKGSTKANITANKERVRSAYFSIRYPETIKGYTRKDAVTKSKTTGTSSLSTVDGTKGVIKESFNQTKTELKSPTISISKTSNTKYRYITATYTVKVVTTTLKRTQAGGKKSLDTNVKTRTYTTTVKYWKKK